MPNSPNNYGLPVRVKRRAANAVQIQEAPAPSEPVETQAKPVGTRHEDESGKDYAIPHDPVTGEVINDEPPQVVVGTDGAAEGSSTAAEAEQPSSQRPPAWRRFQKAIGDSNALQLVVAGVVFGSGLFIYSFFQAKTPMAVPASQGPEAMEEFPQVDLGKPQRVTLTEDDVNRILVRDVRVAPRPGVAPSVTPFADKKAMQSPTREKLAVGSRRPEIQRQSPSLQYVARPEEITPTLISESFYGQGGTIEVVKPSASSARLGIEPGRSIPVKLQVGVSSSYFGIVLAQVTEDVSVDGKPVLARGDVLKGRASSDQERLFIDFYEASTAAQTARLTAYATEDGLPGIVATKRAASAEERRRARAANGALEVLKQATNTVAAMPGGAVGQMAGSVASNVAGQTINEMQRDVQPVDPGVVLQASQGKEFNVVVTGG